ncbi:hypothetical protein BDW02DRAFT_336374 [Decorospora gaudefroyi]|uniref:Uncharacterized protein n=1 Tax=Decorospora gaudefroyi TaxID=184978 RepID=A0A6A5KTX6_9PLEO|nr:hypothetical protein BDW02DRAFT_336374 [Decorospora gaudefroyi]
MVHVFYLYVYIWYGVSVYRYLQNVSRMKALCFTVLDLDVGRLVPMKVVAL